MSYQKRNAPSLESRRVTVRKPSRSIPISVSDALVVFLVIAAIAAGIWALGQSYQIGYDAGVRWSQQ